MPNPKRRHSAIRRDKRRTHWKIDGAAVMNCPNCNQPKQPHIICKHCGFYDGRQITITKEME